MPQLFTLMENFDYESWDASLSPPTLCDMISSSIIENATATGNDNSTIINNCVAVSLTKCFFELSNYSILSHQRVQVSVPDRVYINSMIIASTTVIGYAFAGNLINLIGEKGILREYL